MDYPQQVANGGTSAYVTPGTGLLYQQIQAGDEATGLTFLVTDTGLRYGVQTNNDSSAKPSDIGADAKDGKDDKQSQVAKQQQQETHRAQMLLGYKDVKPVRVPANWSQFLPMGPRLDIKAARQPQGS